MQLNGRSVVITGAASGIGRATLTELSRYACRILAADRDAEGLSVATAALEPGRAVVHACVMDLGCAEGVDVLFDRAIDLMDGIELFIANAGFAYYEQLTQPAWDRLEALYCVNTFSPIYAAVKMQRLNEGRPHRTVIVGSAMGALAVPGYAIYSSSKAALNRFAEAYRLELPDPAMLTMVYPIATRTEFFKNAAHRGAPEPWPVQSAETVAKAIVVGIERDRADIYPSGLFRAALMADRLLPFVRRIEQWIEARRFRRWLSDSRGAALPGS